jgi:hypothetical protein
MMTLEELHAHYKAVRARLDKPQKKEPAVRLIYPEPMPEPYPDPLDAPAPVAAPVAPAETPARKILMEVADKHKMPVTAFRSPSRKMPFVKLRREACYRLSTELKFSLSQIGRLMGNQDHTTVLHSIRQHKKILVEGDKPKTRKSRVSRTCVTQVEPQAQHDHG